MSEMENLQIRPLRSEDKKWVSNFLREHWHSTKIVSRRGIHQADELPGFIAVQGENYLGLATYRIEGDECELVTLNSLLEGMGIGTELLKAVMKTGIAAKCRRVWAVVTNDNLDALRFFQTRGFVLAALHRNAVEKSRELKPEIPTYGMDSIPIRDEIEVEMNF